MIFLKFSNLGCNSYSVTGLTDLWLSTFSDYREATEGSHQPQPVRAAQTGSQRL